MRVVFRIEYRTLWGQSVHVSGSLPKLGNWDAEKAVELMPEKDGVWSGEIEVGEAAFSYNYFLKMQDGTLTRESGVNRHFRIDSRRFDQAVLLDHWRPQDGVTESLLTSPFLHSFFKREPLPFRTSYTKKGRYIRFQLRAPRIGKDYVFGLLGSHEALGNWNPAQVILMNDADFPVWKADVEMGKDTRPFEYKFVIFSHKEKRIVTWEDHANRYFDSDPSNGSGSLLVRTDESFRYPVGQWKGAGVAIPVFSLRSEQCTGVGEFADIKPLIDWAVAAGMKLVQVLPVNDTTASHTWVDSYPYAAVSVHALHPLYASLQAFGVLKNKQLQKEINAERKRLGQLAELDYEAVMTLKWRFFRESFSENKEAFLADTDFHRFFEINQSWLIPYAVFCMLRDKFGTPDFTKWGKYAVYRKGKLGKLTQPGSEDYDELALHYYIQYHLDRQLKEVSTYAREKGVVLKGDIPIGIYRNSVDAWINPHLFYMDCQAGAPPDDFSVSGQNWGFPTYNWEEMAKDGFRWWTDRLIKMSEYFDVFRIDHILGFFRIWEIPLEYVEGIMGRFNPALPIGKEEFDERGIRFDKDRFCRPYIRRHIVHQVFNSHADYVVAEYLDEYSPGCFEMKPGFDTQRKIKERFDHLILETPQQAAFFRWLRDGLYRLLTEVLFLEVAGSCLYNPRIAFHSTYSYQELDDETKQRLDALYNHYFYHRHNDFWRESALSKLPALKSATDMLICGEDLGMVPASVPGVMRELSLLSLAIQRMPGDDREFWHPSDTPYLSVTSTGSHDMSTLREWWQEDPDRSQRFYNQILGHGDGAPYYCEPWLAKEIIEQHFYGPAMWAILPLQDYLAMDGRLRREMPEDERINVPANPQHYWKYRLHLTMEELQAEEGFSSFLRQLVDRGGRRADY